MRYTASGSDARNDLAILPQPAFPGQDKGLVQAEGLDLQCILMLAVGAGELRFTSQDPQTLPTVDFRYLTEPWDRQRLRETLRLGAHVSEQPELKAIVDTRITPTDKDLESDAALDNWLLKNQTVSGHMAGTCKMGRASDPKAVVDGHCRVHGLKGLRVVDASVMPDNIRANTAATVIMIAERVADLIKECVVSNPRGPQPL